jgi:hypothetical protein
MDCARILGKIAAAPQGDQRGKLCQDHLWYPDPTESAHLLGY